MLLLVAIRLKNHSILTGVMCLFMNGKPTGGLKSFLMQKPLFVLIRFANVTFVFFLYSRLAFSAGFMKVMN